ncbi:hypothetical protein [Streptomyces sp. NPDC023327]|uniref:hypothetical protein n=1 Tax=Streptomyces sp. NPDC023327 TaxID=3157088 RepID=UPI0033C01615
MLQNKSFHRRFAVGVATLVASAMIGTVMSGAAVAADRTQGKATRATVSEIPMQGIKGAGLRLGARDSRVDAAPSPVGSSLADVGDEKGIAAVQQALDLIGSIPESLIQRLEAGDEGAAQEVADFLNQGASAKPATRGWFQCAAGVAKFAAENAIGVAKVYRIVKNGKKVAKAVWDYIKHKKYPGNVDDDIANLIVNSTGLPALAEACL